MAQTEKGTRDVKDVDYDAIYDEIVIQNREFARLWTMISGVRRANPEQKHNLSDVGANLIRKTYQELYPSLVSNIDFDMRESNIGSDDTKANELINARAELILALVVTKSLDECCVDRKSLNAAIGEKYPQNFNHLGANFLSEVTAVVDKQKTLLIDAYKSFGMGSYIAKNMLAQDMRVIDTYFDKEIKELRGKDMIEKMGRFAKAESKKNAAKDSGKREPS